MTQVLALRCADGFVLAADTCVWVQSLLGETWKGSPERKVFVLGSAFGVLSFGSGPPGIHVPTQIASLEPAGDVDSLARALYSRFAAGTTRPSMGLLVAGLRADAIVLLEIDVASGVCVERTESVVARGQIREPDSMPGWRGAPPVGLSYTLAGAEAERLILETARTRPDSVSAPVEIVLVSGSGARRLK